MSKEEQEKQLIDITSQLNQGRALITDPQERRQLAELNFQAGLKAKTNTAYSIALEFFSVSLHCSPFQDYTQQNWGDHSEGMFALLKEYAACAYALSAWIPLYDP